MYFRNPTGWPTREVTTITSARDTISSRRVASQIPCRETLREAISIFKASLNGFIDIYPYRLENHKLRRLKSQLSRPPLSLSQLDEAEMSCVDEAENLFQQLVAPTTKRLGDPHELA